MEIILVRHAPALDKVIAHAQQIKDADRKLTQSGKRKFKRHILNNVFLFEKSKIIFSSPYLRARETAKILQKNIPTKTKIVFSSLLIPQGSILKFIDFLKTQAYLKIVIVSHEPFLSELVAEVTGIPSNSIHLKKSALVGLRLQPNGRYRLFQLNNP